MSVLNFRATDDLQIRAEKDLRDLDQYSSKSVPLLIDVGGYVLTTRRYDYSPDGSIKFGLLNVLSPFNPRWLTPPCPVTPSDIPVIVKIFGYEYRVVEKFHKNGCSELLSWIDCKCEPLGRFTDILRRYADSKGDKNMKKSYQEAEKIKKQFEAYADNAMEAGVCSVDKLARQFYNSSSVSRFFDFFEEYTRNLAIEYKENVEPKRIRELETLERNLSSELNAVRQKLHIIRGA